MGNIRRVWKKECDCGCDYNYNCGKYNVIGYWYQSVSNSYHLYFGSQETGDKIVWTEHLTFTDSQLSMLEAILDLNNDGSKYIAEENCKELFENI